MFFYNFLIFFAKLSLRLLYLPEQLVVGLRIQRIFADLFPFLICWTKVNLYGYRHISSLFKYNLTTKKTDTKVSAEICLYIKSRRTLLSKSSKLMASRSTPCYHSLQRPASSIAKTILFNEKNFSFAIAFKSFFSKLYVLSPMFNTSCFWTLIYKNL